MSDMKRTAPSSPMGERILMRMKELGFNAKQLSLAAGLNETYVRDLLKAEKPNPRLQHLKALTVELGVSIDWLDSGEEQSQSAEIVDIWGRIIDREDKKRFEEYGRKLSNKDERA